MRFLAIALIAALAACATAGGDPEIAPDAASPFPVERGTAPPPPAQGGQTPPPEGRAPGGIDFGQWRGADPAAYAAAFHNQILQRYADGRAAAQVRADLEANGFACEDAQRLDCRIEIAERDCMFDWYVVLERANAAPIVGFDQACLGARGAN